jgi:hypothetical protein
LNLEPDEDEIDSHELAKDNVALIEILSGSRVQISMNKNAMTGLPREY